MFVFLFHACTFDISFHLNTCLFVSCGLMSVPLGVRSVVCQGWYLPLSKALFWSLSTEWCNTIADWLSLPDCSAATIPRFCGNRWGLYGPVIPASRHHSRSTGALYAPDVYGVSGEGWVHFHYHLCIHLSFLSFSVPIE